MKPLTNLDKTYDVISIGHWWTKRQIVIFKTGKELARHKATEHSLPPLVRTKRVREAKWVKKKIYSVSGSSNHIYHGLCCTEILVRFVASRSGCEVIGEGRLRRDKNGVVPEFGIRYPQGTILLVEYCTTDNAKRYRLIPRKVNQYKKYLENLEATYNAQGVVVFIIDLPIDEVKQLAARYLEGLNFIYFSSYESFLKVPLGSALYYPIYFMANGVGEGLSNV